MINKFKERRVRQIQITSDRILNERNPNTHDYSNPPDLYEVLVVIEPQPVWDESNKGKVHGRHSWNETIEKEIHWGKAPLKLGDVIKGQKVLAVLGVEEKWAQTKDFDEGYPKQTWHWKFLTTKGE